MPDADPHPRPAPPPEGLGRLFLRFLRFGLLAWGGPVAQIAMIRRQLVDEERWITSERFNRTLAVYQALPGPEAHELCVFFGMLARGRVGGFLAGLGFMLPGFAFITAASWFYLTYGTQSPLFLAGFAGFQAAVVALMVRAVHRIGSHALHDPWLVVIAATALVGSVAGLHFLLILAVAGAAYMLVGRAFHRPAAALLALSLGTSIFLLVSGGSPNLPTWGAAAPPPAVGQAASGAVHLLELLASGLRAGLLTFGGAYTAVPFLQQDAVISGGWMTNQQFLDGVALAGVLPAPLIMFAAFVGYLAGGPLGSAAMTVGVFLPAFGFTLVGHRYLEWLVEMRAVHAFLDGVTAGVVGLVATTTLLLAPVGFASLPALAIFLVGLAALYLWKANAAVAVVVLASGVLGILLLR